MACIEDLLNSIDGLRSIGIDFVGLGRKMMICVTSASPNPALRGDQMPIDHFNW